MGSSFLSIPTVISDLNTHQSTVIQTELPTSGSERVFLKVAKGCWDILAHFPIYFWVSQLKSHTKTKKQKQRVDAMARFPGALSARQMCELQVRVQQAPKPTAPSGFCEAWLEAQKHSLPPRGLEARAGKVPGKTAGRSRRLESPPTILLAQRQEGTGGQLTDFTDASTTRRHAGLEQGPAASELPSDRCRTRGLFPAPRGWHLPSTQLSQPQRHLPPSTPQLKLKTRREGNLSFL